MKSAVLSFIISGFIFSNSILACDNLMGVEEVTCMEQASLEQTMNAMRRLRTTLREELAEDGSLDEILTTLSDIQNWILMATRKVPPKISEIENQQDRHRNYILYKSLLSQLHAAFVDVENEANEGRRSDALNIINTRIRELQKHGHDLFQ